MVNQGRTQLANFPYKGQPPGYWKSIIPIFPFLIHTWKVIQMGVEA